MEKKETMGKVEILLATIIWGFAFVVIRDALTVVPFHADGMEIYHCSRYDGFAVS